MKDVQKVTFGGMITALVTVMMLFEGFLSIGGAYLVPGIAGIIILFMTYATGLKWGVYTYISSSAVSFMLCMDKEAVLCFVLLLGYYPMLRYVFEKIKNPILKIVVKLIFFNITAAVIFLTATFLLAVPLEKIEIFGISFESLFFFLANVTFVLYEDLLDVIEKKLRNIVTNRIQRVFRIS